MIFTDSDQSTVIFSYPEIVTKLNQWSEAAVQVERGNFSVKHSHKFDDEIITIEVSLGIKLKLRLLETKVKNKIRVQGMFCITEFTEQDIKSEFKPIDCIIELNKKNQVYKLEKNYIRTKRSTE